MSDTMFDTLLQLPLFQGLTLDDLTSILEKARMHFERHAAGDVIEQAGEPCNHLTFILRGEVEVKTVAPDAVYAVTESFKAPYLVEPQSLFGLYTGYIGTCSAVGEVATVRLDKQAAAKELFNYEICRLNYQNMLCSRVQNLHRRLWTSIPTDLEARIVQFILVHVERPAGPKSLKIKMEDLAQIMNDTRSNVSRILNRLQEEGKVVLRRGEVMVPEAAYLL